LYSAWMFVKRGFIHNTSYRVAFGLNFVNVLVGVVSFYYLSRLIESGNTTLLAEYGNNAAAFIVVGTTFNSFVSLALRSYSGSVSSEQSLGIIEHWWMARTPLMLLVIFSTFWEFLWPLLTSIVTFGMLALAFQVSFNINLPTAILVFFLTLTSTSGLGLMSAGVIMISKQGDPIGFLWGVLSGLLSGVYYPITVLPDWLQVVSSALPTTYALRALREAFINGASLYDIRQELAILVAFTLVTVPLGLWAFQAGFNRARREGSLAQY